MSPRGAVERPGSRLAAAGPAGLGRGLILLLAGVLSGCAAAGPAGGDKGGVSSSAVHKAVPAGAGAVGRLVPEMTFERLNGKKLLLSSLRGKVVLLDVWASWCVPCIKELPMLDGMARRLRSKGVEVVAVSIDQERENLVKFLESRPQWTLTIGHDPAGAIADALQPEKMPTSYAIDRTGIIRHINEGFEPADAASIERKLAELAER